MSVDKDIKSFREALEAEHSFPTVYTFKFILPEEKDAELKALFPDESFNIRASSGGKYYSYTLKKEVMNSDEVITVYQKAYNIEGIISM